MLEQQLRQRIVGGELAAARPRRSTAGRSPSSSPPAASSCSNRISPSCFGEPRLNGWPASCVGLLLERHHALAELAALRGEQRRSRSARRCAPCGTALRAPASRSSRRRNRASRRRRRADAARRCSCSVMSASSAEYSVARSIATWSKPICVRALAGHLGVGDRLHVEMAPREIVHVVRPVRLEHVRLRAACRARRRRARGRDWRARAGRT